ncbi:LysR family transcriptional regulator [Paracoccus laeviglucosivorans]|uniref:Transcriptional regulator, LysR family n=1 Tax=Paracoccus laeviglucosivorans TaxID=1197861 RepID=A0A521AZH7_9RHOB|nr:LysR family transcriptional regulator [Paracoccus laeviglucosivorans]SMO40247.1 transcriptional regulator, LysR family [Paracoccus laeviglucosivorans]
MHPNLVDHLQAFCAIVDQGSLTAAARELRRPISSVSYSLTQLEAQCGFPLLGTGTSRAELTPRGRVLLTEARSVVERARSFTTHAQSLEVGEETRLRVLVDVLFPRADLNRALRDFALAHPHARCQFFSSSLATLWDELRDGDFDFALTLAAAIPLDISARHLASEVLAPVCAAGHRLARLPQPLPMRAFDRERQIYYVGSPLTDMERVGRLFSPDVWTVNDVDAIKSMVVAGLGWCFSASRTFAAEMQRGEVVRLTCEDMQFHPARTIVVAWPAHRRPGPLGQQMVDALTAGLGNPGGAGQG